MHFGSSHTEYTIEERGSFTPRDNWYSSRRALRRLRFQCIEGESFFGPMK